jgi:hypothetical protein
LRTEIEHRIEYRIGYRIKTAIRHTAVSSAPADASPAVSGFEIQGMKQKTFPQALESRMHFLRNLAALRKRAIRREDAMLSHCANPQCSKPFLRLRQGRLFLVEAEGPAQSGNLKPQANSRMRIQPQEQRPKQKQRVERYWLCDQCSEVWTMVHDQTQGVVLVPLQRPAANAQAAITEERRESA